MELQRIESISKSPLFNHFSETLNGVASVRAYGLIDQFVGESDSRTDANSEAFAAVQVGAGRMVVPWLGGLVVWLFRAVMVVVVAGRREVPRGSGGGLHGTPSLFSPFLQLEGMQLYCGR